MTKCEPGCSAGRGVLIGSMIFVAGMTAGCQGWNKGYDINAFDGAYSDPSNADGFRARQFKRIPELRHQSAAPKPGKQSAEKE